MLVFCLIVEMMDWFGHGVTASQMCPDNIKVPHTLL